jgi:hypothetical protein
VDLGQYLDLVIKGFRGVEERLGHVQGGLDVQIPPPPLFEELFESCHIPTSGQCFQVADHGFSSR